MLAKVSPSMRQPPFLMLGENGRKMAGIRD